MHTSHSPHHRDAPKAPARGPALRDHGVSFVWGLAEGTFFFIVPDVWLSALAMKSPARAYRASTSALAGALLGGALTYSWGRRLGATRSRRALVGLPAISDRMIDTVEEDMARGMYRMILGPLRGTPYKIYARTAGLRAESLPRFLLWSIPARIPRFLLVAGGTALATRLGRKALGRRRPAIEKVIFGAGWAGFYTWFFRTVGREAAPS